MRQYLSLILKKKRQEIYQSRTKLSRIKLKSIRCEIPESMCLIYNTSFSGLALQDSERQGDLGPYFWSSSDLLRNLQKMLPDLVHNMGICCENTQRLLLYSTHIIFRILSLISFCWFYPYVEYIHLSFVLLKSQLHIFLSLKLIFNFRLHFKPALVSCNSILKKRLEKVNVSNRKFIWQDIWTSLVLMHFGPATNHH